MMRFLSLPGASACLTLVVIIGGIWDARFSRAQTLSQSDERLANQLEEQSMPAVEVLSDEECWKRLPATTAGGGEPLPVWARAVATQLPRTAAAMLKLDYAHRVQSPIDPLLRAKLRWVVANENQCEYSRVYAIADLKRAGADSATIQKLLEGTESWLTEEREALEFVRLLTVAAPTITDEHFRALQERYGDRQVAAMILLAAYGNFQDRILLGLNLGVEETGPLPPLQVEFVVGAFQLKPFTPESTPPTPLETPHHDVVADDEDWSTISYEELQTRLEQQRSREPRLPIPTWESVKDQLPAEMATNPTRIVWSLVTYGYAAELQIPWSIATRTMWAELPGDRVFEESLFWIQTRTIQCNYCMGHCEMLLEVAGLDQTAIAERTRNLASDDWSAFPETEQRAFAYARKLSGTPWLLTPEDYQTLVVDLGPDKAMSTFWWLCRGLYMTRVSDGFQLPLERENVFAPPK